MSKKAKKKIAVLVRDRTDEALRMGIGVTLADDLVTVFVLDRELEKNEDNVMNLDIMKSLNVMVFTNHKGNENIEYISTGEIAQRLLEFDHILPY